MSLDFQGSWSNEFLKEFKKMNEQLAAISKKLSPTPAKKVTLVYSPGAYATGDVPESVTVDAGTEVEIEFNPFPSRDGHSFVGWATTDGASEAEFTGKDTDTIIMTEDVTLYPVYEEVGSYSVNYVMGDYADGGDIPSGGSYTAGDTVYIEFSPHPTRTSYDFVGWASSDGAEYPLYEEGGTDMIDSIYDDVTLYPVFVEQGMPTYRVTYHMGNSADGGDVPSEESYSQGNDVTVDFSTHPTLTGYDFIGWAESDGASVAEFTETGTNSITYISRDYDLYPVFEQSGGGGGQPTDKLVIDNTNGAVDVIVGYSDDPNPVAVSAGTSEDFVYNADETFYISFASKPDISNSSAYFTGTMNGSSYTDEECSIDDTYVDNGAIGSPEGDWMFASGEGGTLTITSAAAGE